MPPRTRFDGRGNLTGEHEDDLFNEQEWMNGANYDGGASDAPEADAVLSRIPILGGGSRAAIAAAEGRREEGRNREYWDQLTNYMPSADDLSVDYANEDYVPGSESEWAQEMHGTGSIEDALAAMEGWSRGGLTDTDRAMMGETGRTEGIRSRGDREAAISAMEARGIGGGGMDLMARMGADEAGAGRTAARDTSMMAAAQQRQYNATEAMGSLGSALDASEGRRASALYSWTARDEDYRRGLEGRNTERENRGRESRSTGAQQAYENRERATAGATNQYSTDVGRRAGEGRRADENDDRTAGLIGGILESL
jgi:hypothetical protein